MHLENCRKGRQRESCANSALGASVIKHLLNPTESRSVDEQVDVQHDWQSPFVFRLDSDSSVMESFGAYLSLCAICNCS